ncbi:unnamed protein product [Strongylus vulgaris]|uniref:Uncharacterized protein n=1 Tax=Strongylus vulgaris TaxID=40348 RepID=A0A3P7LW99_STRVU|nr:unnamed protein product [Strongylus vulgaris]
MSTLALLVEGSACAWGKLAVLHGSETINDVIRALVDIICQFASIYLRIQSAAAFCVRKQDKAKGKQFLSALEDEDIQLFRKMNQLLYNSQRGTAVDASVAMLNALRETLRDSANSDDDRMGSPLAAVLSHAICHLKRTDGAGSLHNDATTTSSSSGRIIIVAMTVDFGTEHG